MHREIITSPSPEVGRHISFARVLRTQALETPGRFGLGYRNITKCCTEVCPEHIKITDNALIPMKERVVGRKYDPLTWLGERRATT